MTLAVTASHSCLAGRLPEWRLGLAKVDRKLLPSRAAFRASGVLSVIPPMPATFALPSLSNMFELPVHRVEVSFVGGPPAQHIGRDSGVSEVEVDGQIVRCFASGSFQPLLEALGGHEVVSPESSATSSPSIEGGRYGTHRESIDATAVLDQYRADPQFRRPLVACSRRNVTLVAGVNLQSWKPNASSANSRLEWAQ